jgi:hypothetical protein
MSRQPFQVQFMIVPKYLQNVEHLNYLASMITNETRFTREIKSRIAMAKAAFNKKETIHQQSVLKFWEEACKLLHLVHRFLCCWNVDTLKSRSGIIKNFEMLYRKEMEKIISTNCVKNELLRRVKAVRNILRTIKGKKVNWIGHILRRNCL